MPDLLFGPTPYKEAIAFLASKPVLAREVFDQLLPELKAVCFTIGGIEDMGVQQSVLDATGKVPAGVPWDKAKKEIVSKLHPYLDDSESGQKRSEARAELLLRTHGFQAMQTASYEVMNRQRDVFPYWQYKSMEDGRVRPAHAALDGIVLPCNHEFWKSHFPPWQWNCRCQVIPLSEDDYGDIQKEDEDKPKDQRAILDEGAQETLTTKRVLVRNGIAHNVSSDAEKGKEGAYSWHPDDMRPDLARLKERHDPALFAKFEQTARALVLEDGTTLWDWLNGAKLKPGKPKPAPAPEPKPARASATPAEPKTIAAPSSPATTTGQPLAFQNKAEALAWADANMHPVRKMNFSKEELKALQTYQGNAYLEINRSLRKGYQQGRERKALLKTLDGTIKKSVLAQDTIVWRGVGPEAVRRFTVGKSVSDKAYTSTTLARATAEHFAQTGGKGGAVLRIVAPKGKHAAYPDGLQRQHAGEAELLFGRNTKLHVLSKTLVDGTWYIEAEVI